MKCFLLILVSLSATHGEDTASDKKRGLSDETYHGAETQGMIIKTHYAQDHTQEYINSDGLDKDFQLALIPTGYVQTPYALPETQYNRQLPLVQKQYYLITRKVPLPYVGENLPYAGQSPPYASQPAYQVKVPYPSSAVQPYLYRYRQPVNYFVQKPVPVLTDDRVEEDYQRIPINEQSAYQYNVPLRKIVPVSNVVPYYFQKPLYVQKEVYAPKQHYGYNIQVPDQQIAVQKPHLVPIFTKNIQ